MDGKLEYAKSGLLLEVRSLCHNQESSQCVNTLCLCFIVQDIVYAQFKAERLT